MKIAIVTPLAIPFALGGAENLWWGLQSHIEDHSPHSCDIISVNSPERALPELVSSYETFSQLDLSAYDMVITGKYPAWMIDHPNHVCYMLHRLRGLYDTYAGPIGIDERTLSAPLVGLVRWMHATAASPQPIDKATLADFFERYRNATASLGANEALAFPGPLAREIVHFLDDAALAPGRIRSYAAISQTVARRKGYFPPGVPVAVRYPPPHRADYHLGNDDYFFTSSRLDPPKRVGLLVEAMRKSKADVPLLIAGTGPDEARLKALAGNDPRIRFLGFVPDDDMPALYADALAVPFLPFDEDYGLVTIEAMRSGKPVLTVSDAGGPCEFVRDGQTGLVVSADVDALANGLERLAANRAEARAMGAAARQSVETIDWKSVLAGLLAPVEWKQEQRQVRRPKLTVAATFPIWPPMGGGQARIFHLYRHLAAHYDIDIVSMSDAGGLPTEKEIAPGVMEIRVPKSERHLAYEQSLSIASNNIPIGDIGAHFLSGLTPAYGDALATSAESSEAIVLSHPYLLADAKAVAGKPLWYEAQDVEFDLKQNLFLPLGENGAPLLEGVRTVERACWREATHVFCCASRDLTALGALYGGTRAHLHEVPNGVALDEIDFTAPERRRALQEAAGLTNITTALFMGSWHAPNLEAIEEILEAATGLPEVRFLILGSACTPFRGRSLLANVEMLGQVEAQIRDDLLAVADVALNPMQSGSGTNLKMLDYFASGVPVISSRFGARGLAVQEGLHYELSEDGQLAAALRGFMTGDSGRRDAMVRDARTLVEQRYSWQVIAQNFLEDLARTGVGSLAGTSTDP